jgi:alanyl-tRNA synthetase
LGNEVEQRGSNITPERLRFDFSYPQKMTKEQITEVENIVNTQIKAGLQVFRDETTVAEAKATGAIGLFGDKYGEKISVYSVGAPISSKDKKPFSREICTGPHVTNISELGHFKILKEEASSAGIRRIKAVVE